MEDLLKKVSQYQLFNFLMSGAVLVAALSKTTDIHLGSDDVILSFFLYYFVGLVISRVGSLVVEPTLKLLRVIKYLPYTDYVQAAQLDAKLDTLSQENNTYRTLIATFLMFIGFYLLDKHAHSLLSGKSSVVIVGGAALLILLFAFAYHKQTKYITKRINKALQNNP
jgi:hypothetical protein